ncbi:LOW QUALITY PROTEIN: hypothetical protein HID58_034511, partial [Brassica napus]
MFQDSGWFSTDIDTLDDLVLTSIHNDASSTVSLLSHQGRALVLASIPSSPSSSALPSSAHSSPPEERTIFASRHHHSWRRVSSMLPRRRCSAEEEADRDLFLSPSPLALFLFLASPPPRAASCPAPASSQLPWLSASSPSGIPRNRWVALDRTLQSLMRSHQPMPGDAMVPQIVCVGAKAGGLRSVGGAIFVLLDQTEEEFPLGLSSSDGGGRSPYSPPSIFPR